MALVPLVIIVAICIVDLAGGPGFVIIALVAVAPLLAATFLSPRPTGAYAVAALAGASIVAISDQVVDPNAGGGRAAMAIRLAGIAIGGGIAMVASRARVSRERRLAAVVRVVEGAQRAILSTVPAMAGGLRFATTYQSAATEADIGGDLFYEVVDSPWGVRLLVGDTRGNGLEAVRLASRVLGCFRTLAGRLPSPDGLVEVLDSEVAGFDSVDGDLAGFDSEVAGFDGGNFVTAIVAQIDRAGQMLLFNAGHPDPLLIRDGEVEVLDICDRQPPLGLGTAPEGAWVRICRSDRLLFYTDGLAEARHWSTRELFPLVPAVQAAFTGKKLADAIAHLVDGLLDWTGGPLGDDVALVAVERLGAGSGSGAGEVGRTPAATVVSKGGPPSPLLPLPGGVGAGGGSASATGPGAVRRFFNTSTCYNCQRTAAISAASP